MMNNSQGKPYFSIIVVIGCILAISLVVIFSPPALASIPPLNISGYIPLKIPAHKSTDNPVDSRPFFDNFSWESFIALNWPADVEKGRGVPIQPDNPLQFYDPPQDTPVVWETYREAFDLFSQDGKRPPAWNDNATYDPCNSTAKPGDKTFVMLSKSGTLLEGRNEDDLDEFNEAFAFPLIDQHKNYALYEIHFDQPQYDFVRGEDSNQTSWLYLRENLNKVEDNGGVQMPASTDDPPKFPPKLGSLMVKAAWREMTEEDINRGRYYMVDAHVINPETGVCDPGTKKVGLVGLHIVHKLKDFPEWIWSTFEQVDNVPDNKGSVNPPYSFNNGTKEPKTYDGYANRPQSIVPPLQPKDQRIPVQGTRLNAIPTTPQGASTAQINAAYQEQLKDTVWKYYQLVETQWPVNPEKFKIGGNYPYDTGNAFPAFGVANTTMETYKQTDSCMKCHFSAGKLIDPTTQTSLNGAADFSWTLQQRAYPKEQLIKSLPKEN